MNNFLFIVSTCWCRSLNDENQTEPRPHIIPKTSAGLNTKSIAKLAKNVFGPFYTGLGYVQMESHGRLVMVPAFRFVSMTDEERVKALELLEAELAKL